MQPWLLALIVLVGVCAIGAYYVHNTSSYIYDAEGFDASGNLASYLKGQALAKCDKEYSFCMEAGKANNTTCTARYNVCNTAAQALDTSVSTVNNAAGSSTTLSSAAGALAYAKGLGMSGAGDAINVAKSGKLLNLQYGNTKPFDSDPTTTEDSSEIYTSSRLTDIFDDTTPLDPKMVELKKKIEKGYKPDSIDFKSAQGLGIITESENDAISLYSRLSDYTSRPQPIKPHETPKGEESIITAKVRSDEGTDAEYGADTGKMESLRSMIRRDIKQAIREELDAINNEYEIVYE